MESGAGIAYAIISKFEKDEHYTFLCGFGLGLLYYLVCFSRFENNTWTFLISNTYLAALMLLTFWLLATLILYIVYAFIYYLSGIYVRSRIEVPRSGRLHIDVSKNRPDFYLKFDDVISYHKTATLIWGLLSSVLLLLVPFIWTVHYINVNFAPSLCLSLLFTLLLLGCSAGFLCALAIPSLVDFMKIDHLVDAAKVKITYSKDEYAKQLNMRVDKVAQGKSQQS